METGALVRKSTHWRLCLGGLLGIGSLLSMARGKDANKCQQAQDGARQSVKAGDTALLQRWREYAYRHCSDRKLLTALDQELAQELNILEQKKREAERIKQQSQALLGVFVGWAAAARAAPETASISPSCEGGEAEAKSRERWCTARRVAGQYPLEVRYWDKESTAARFSTVMPGPTRCEDLGPHRLIRTWTIPGTTAKRSHCELTGGALSGLQALVVDAVNGPLEVFSPRFLELDPSFATRVQTEGR